MDDSLIHIGTSGWSYNHWAGDFYPAGLRKSKWLAYYSGEFGTVEINSSFYHLPKPQTFINWSSSTPDNFIFSVKVSRYITHIKRLADCGEALKRLLSTAEMLGEKLGVFLFQLPPNFKKDRSRLTEILNILPEHGKFAFEFRDDTWFEKEIYELLNDSGCAVVISSSPKFPFRQVITGSLCYIRMHGSQHLYRSCYPKDELKRVAWLINRNLKKNIETYVYFNNDAESFAVENARTLKELMRQINF